MLFVGLLLNGAYLCKLLKETLIAIPEPGIHHGNKDSRGNENRGTKYFL